MESICTLDSNDLKLKLDASFRSDCTKVCNIPFIFINII